MAHLLDVYARTAGLRIEKMRLFEQFYPLSVEGKYIVFVTSTGQPGKGYNHYRDVLWLLKDTLKEAGYTTVQAGLKEDIRIGCDVDVCGQTNFGQFFYVIQGAALLISGDTAALHAAGHYNVPLVSLFSLTHPNCSGSYYGDKSKQIYLVPEFEGYKPSFNAHESPKTINLIEPEKVADNAAKLLNLENHKIETIHVGSKYIITGVEVIPDHRFGRETLAGMPLNIRLDFGGEEQTAFYYLSHRKCNIITKHPVNVNALKVFRGNLENLIYQVDDNYDLSFIDALKKNAIPYALMTDFPQEKIDSLKEQFMDYGILQKRDSKTKENTQHPNLVTPNTKFRTGKFIISQGRIFMSKAHLAKDESIPSFEDNEGTIIDTPEFWREQDYSFIYNDK